MDPSFHNRLSQIPYKSWFQNIQYHAANQSENILNTNPVYENDDALVG